VVVVFEVEPARQVALAKAISDFARKCSSARRLSFGDSSSVAGRHANRQRRRMHRRAAFDAYAAEPRTEASARAILEFAKPTLMRVSSWRGSPRSLRRPLADRLRLQTRSTTFPSTTLT